MGNFKNIFLKYKKKKGESFRSLGVKTGLSDTYLNFLAKGKTKPTFSNIIKIAEALEFDPLDIEEYRVGKASKLLSENPALVDKILYPKKSKVTIPVLGRVPADNLRETFEVHLDDVPSFAGADFAIIVSGDCLLGAHIEDGDIVYIKKQSTANKGELVLARYNGNVTLKFFHPEGKRIILKPANPDFEEIVLNTVEIIGIKVAVLKK